MTGNPNPGGTMMAQARTIAFQDAKGNRFVFPGWIIREDNEDDLRSTADFWGSALLICARTDCTQETIEFDPDNFPNVPASAGSSIFFHGGEEVLLFAGPTFDAVATEQVSS